MRRRLLLSATVGGITGLAGCSSLFSDTSSQGGSQNETENKSGSPNLPYRAKNNSENVDTPVGVTLNNTTTEDVYVTLVVSKAKPPAPGGDESAFAAPRPFEAGRTLFTKSAEIPGAGAKTFYGLIAARGVYHVAVHVKNGLRGGIGVVVPGPSPTIQIQKQTVAVGGGSLILWTPGRAPYPAEGEAKKLPYAGSGSSLMTTQSSGTKPSLIAALNRTDQWQPFSLEISDGETTILDYRYAVPAGVGLSIVPVSTSGPFEVTLGEGMGATTFAWRPKKQPTLRLRLNGGATQVGGERSL